MAETTYLKSVVFSKNMEFDGPLNVDGDLTCAGLVVKGDLKVTGRVLARLCVQVHANVTVGRSIDAGLELRAGGDVTATGDVTARRLEVGGRITASGNIRAHGLVAGKTIAAGGAVEANLKIHCGGSIEAGAWVQCTSLDIRCSELKNRLVPFGREFWAGLPMLSKWREPILDPKTGWSDLRRLPSAHEAKQLVTTHFGHWSLEGQLRVFLGVEDTVVAPSAARADIPPVRFGPLAAPVSQKASEPRAASPNPLLAIVLDPTKTPFPNYSGNASYQYIEQYLKQHGILNMDLRAAYADLNVNLNDLYSTINGLPVPDPSVKTQILAELNAATNVRLNHSNMLTLINSTILADDLKVQYVGGMVTAEDSDACSCDVLGMLENILGFISVIPDIGPIFTIFQAIIGLGQSAGGGFQSVNAAYNELVGALGAQLDKLLTVNGQIAEALLTDWGKLQRANALIIDGTLAWPADDSAAVTGTANGYEIEVFKVLFPIHWWPTYTYFVTTNWNCTSCNNAVWIGYGFQDYTAYWITYGGYWWGDCSQAETELARLGVSVQDLTQGGGAWGSTVWAWNRQNPVGCCERPSCCSKSW
jgi:cytoskeletal protein CcmA (bactofilin family)